MNSKPALSPINSSSNYDLEIVIKNALKQELEKDRQLSEIAKNNLINYILEKKQKLDDSNEL